MANVSIEKATATLKKAQTWMAHHKEHIGEIVKAGEAAGLPFLIGAAEGRLASDGSGHVQIGGVPVMLIAAGVGTLGAASGQLGEHSRHAGNAAAGCWGAWAADAGRQIGLKMRAVAGKNVQTALLSRAALDEVQQKLAKKGLQLVEAPVGGARVGQQEQYARVGAQPQVFDAAALERIVAEHGGE